MEGRIRESSAHCGRPEPHQGGLSGPAEQIRLADPGVRRSGLRLLPLPRSERGPGPGSGRLRPHRLRQRAGHRVHGHLRRRPRDAGGARRYFLYLSGPGKGAPDRGTPPGSGPNRRGVHLLGQLPEKAGAQAGRHQLFQGAGAHRPAQLRPDGIRLSGRLHRPGRLWRRIEGPAHHDPRAGGGGNEGLRPAGPRRRGLPHRCEMGSRHEGPQGAEIHRLQCRRGRPRRVHGPLGAGGRPPLHHRGHAPGRLRHRSG